VRVAEVHAFRGEIEEAFRWLLNPDLNHLEDSWPLLFASPLLKLLRDDPRWAHVMHMAHSVQ
jgi:hypothetical protein